MPLVLPQAVADYLSSHHVMTLATQGSDGPWAAAVFYVDDGQSLAFLSSPGSRHCRHLAQDPRCAATIQDNVADWSQIKGIQLEDRAVELHGDDQRAHAGATASGSRSSGCLPRAGRIVEALARVRWYRWFPSGSISSTSRRLWHRDEYAMIEIDCVQRRGNALWRWPPRSTRIGPVPLNPTERDTWPRRIPTQALRVTEIIGAESTVSWRPRRRARSRTLASRCATCASPR
jgi:hypothetical protein